MKKGNIGETKVQIYNARWLSENNQKIWFGMKTHLFHLESRKKLATDIFKMFLAEA